jgi:outer membrane immunogenic protein
MSAFDPKRTSARFQDLLFTVLLPQQPPGRPHGRFCGVSGAVMSKLLISSITGLGLIGTPTFAADMAVKAPPPAPAPLYSWMGWYAGLNAGYGWNKQIDNSATEPFCLGPVLPAFCSAFLIAVPGQFNTHPSGFIGGGQIGYNYQYAPDWVAGVETDFQGADIKGSASVANTVSPTGFPLDPVTLAGTGSQRLDWFGTLRARVGWTAASPFLIYATGGLAYGKAETNVSFFNMAIGGNAVAGFNAPPTAASNSSTLVGWTVGGGLEWMFAPRWSVKGEYLYYDLGNVTLNQTQFLSTPVPQFPVGAALAIQSVAHYQGNIVRVGLNYQFH